jgi:hypothetical protein
MITYNQQVSDENKEIPTVVSYQQIIGIHKKNLNQHFNDGGVGFARF